MCEDLHPAHVPSVPPLHQQGEWSGQALPLEPVDEVSVVTVCDNNVDLFLTDQGPARRVGLARTLGGDRPTVDAPSLEGGSGPDPLTAEHGFSVLVDVRKGDTVHRLLFDTGVSPTGCVENLRRLDRRPGDIEVVVCSHGHFDHTTGLSGLMSRLGRTNMPVVVHPEFWTRRRIAVPGADPVVLPTPSRRDLEGAGFDIVEDRSPSFLFERSVLITGEIDRSTQFEKGFAVHQAHRGDRWEADPLILDDQAMIFHVRGKGLVIVTGCGHAGIVNTCLYAQRLTGVDDIHAVIGGFHLNGPLFEPLIDDTVNALVDLAPDVVVPAHCTGWKATHAIARRLPAAFIPSSVGTTFHLVPG